ncbi:MAG: branched-chain amino acid ABC transporter substrate-binding protein [Alphaproteobacteria bacterium]
MKKTLILAVLLLLPSLSAHAEIKIGLVAPFTGPIALGGEQIRRGAEQAVEDINAKGGINGEKISLYLGDDACDPKQGVSVANKLASAGIKYASGFYCSGSSIPASKVYMEEGILIVTDGASNPKLTDEAKDTVFRVYGRDDHQGVFVGKYLLKTYPGKKIAFIHDKSAWGLGLLEEIRKNYNAGGGKEVIFDSYSPGEKDYSALVSKLKQLNAEVLYLAGFPPEAALIVRQLRENGAKLQVIGGDALTTDQFWSVAGSTGEGTLMSYTADPRNYPGTKPVVAALQKKNFEAAGVTLYAYAAMQVTAEAIRRGGDNPLKAAAALREKPIDTILGPVEFDAKGDMANIKYAMYRWHDGKYAQIEGQ